MRILFISGELIGSALCQKLVQEGNEVKLYIHNDDWKGCLDGIVPKTTDWKNELIWVGKDGLIVFDDIIFGEEQDLLRGEGYRVVGGCGKADLLEADRRHFQETADKHTITTIPSFNFQTAHDAINFVENNKARWVVKQSSHLSVLNFVGEKDDASDVLRVLNNYKKRNITPVHIQQYAGGIEVGVARYFNGTDWVGPVEINHEHKRLNDGDIGPLTPEMGTIIWYTDESVRLFTETLDKMRPHLAEIGFKGDMDINLMVTEDAAYPLEATPRFGTPSTEVHVALHTSPWDEFLSALADGNSYDLGFKNEYGIVVSVAIPPFPFKPDTLDKMRHGNEKRMITLSDKLTDEDLSHVHFEEVSKIDGKYVWAGNYGWVLHVTAHAPSISEAKRIVYDRLKKIKIDNSFYRKDIGDRVEQHDIPTLKKWGWV